MPDDPIQLDDQGHWLDLAGFGRDAWNTWAEKELEKPFSQRKTVNLENVKIKHSDFSGFKFPSYVNFSSAEFQCHAFFSQAHFFGTFRSMAHNLHTAQHSIEQYSTPRHSMSQPISYLLDSPKMKAALSME